MFLQVVDELTRVFGQYIYIFTYIYTFIFLIHFEMYACVRCEEWIKFYILQNMF